MEIYSEIYNLASFYIKKYNRKDVSVEELISNVYLEIADKSLPHTIDNFRKLIIVNAKYTNKNSTEILGEDIRLKKVIGSCDFHKYCTNCKEPCTKDDFYTYTHKTGKHKGKIFEWTECKKCVSNKSQALAKEKLKTDPDYVKRINKKYVESGNYKEYKRLGRLKLDNWYLVEVARYELRKKGITKQEENALITEEYLASIKVKITERRKKRLEKKTATL